MHFVYLTIHLCCSTPSPACPDPKVRNENPCKRKRWADCDHRSAFYTMRGTRLTGGFLLLPALRCAQLWLFLIHAVPWSPLVHMISSSTVAHTVCIAYSRHLLSLLFCPLTGFMWFPRLRFLATLAICLLHVHNICCHPQAVPFMEDLCYHPLPVFPQFHIIFWEVRGVSLCK